MLVQGQHTGARLAVHLKDMLDHFQLTDGHLLGITTGNASSKYLMSPELQSTLQASGIEWPALSNHIRCIAHVIQQAIGAIISSFGLKGRTKSLAAHECNQQFGNNESMDIVKSQRLRKEGNFKFHKVSAIRPHFAKIIEKVRISQYFESSEADLHIAENACWINNANTWSPKRVH
jgi:hypothetical protein